MADLPYLAPGDKPPRSAGRWNAIIDAARAARVTDLANEPKSVVSAFPYRQNDQVFVRNDSNFEFARYSVVGLDEAVFPTAGDHTATLSYLDGPIFSIRPPEGCRHRGRFAVLLQPLKPGGVCKAVLSSSFVVYLDLDQWPSRDPVFVDVDEALTGAEYHTTVYGNRQRPVLKQDPDGSAQVIHAGRDWYTDGVVRTCTGSIDIECEPGGTEWNITRDSCEEGCGGRFAGNIPATPCTPGDTRTNLPCKTGSTAGYVGTVRMGNAKVANPEDCGCRADACRSTCRQTDCDGDCNYVTTFDGGSPTSYAWSPSSNTCTVHCGCRSAAALAADIGYPTSGMTHTEDCRADGTGWHWYITSNGCRGDTRLETTTTTADPAISTTSSSSTTSTSAGITTTTAGPECVCPDLNILRATWPELYPCGATEAVKEQTHFCYTTTTTTSTSTTSTSTTTTVPPTTTSSSSTSVPPTTTSTTVPTTTTTAAPTTTTTAAPNCYANCVYKQTGVSYNHPVSGVLLCVVALEDDSLCVVTPGCYCPASPNVTGEPYFAAIMGVNYDATNGCYTDYQADIPVCQTGDPPTTTTGAPTTTAAPTTTSSSAAPTTTTTAEPTTTSSAGPTSSTTAEPTTTTSGGMSSTTTADPTTTTSAGMSSTTTTAELTTTTAGISSTTTTASPCPGGACSFVCENSAFTGFTWGWAPLVNTCGGVGCNCAGSGSCGACNPGLEGATCDSTCTP